MSEPIKAALEAACATDAFYGANRQADADIRRDRAAAIAAFLRALPELKVCGRSACYLQDIAHSPEGLAAAVERAAREGGG